MRKRATRRVTLQDVADKAGVHKSTASRALDPGARHLITADVVAKVLKAVQQLGYRHNRVAAGLRTRKTRSIGIVVPDITNLLFPLIIRGIEDRIVEQEYVAMIGHTDDDPETERKVIDTFLAHGTEGLAVASARFEDEAIVAAMREGAAVVTVNRRVKDGAVSSVTDDDAAGIGAVFNHLVSLGHREIAYLSGPTSSSTGQARFQAYRHWAKQHRVQGKDRLVVEASAFREAEGERCVDELLASRAPFTAIICANDLLAMGAMASLRKWGISCPREVSVTGFNDLPFVDRVSPSLTTVRAEHYNCGWTAAGILLDDLRKVPEQRVVRHVVLPVSLIVRESTGPAPAAAGRRQKRRGRLELA
jgi:LacI family transcriptional regulator